MVEVKASMWACACIVGVLEKGQGEQEMTTNQPDLMWELEQVEKRLSECYSPASNIMNIIRDIQFRVKELVNNQGSANGDGEGKGSLALYPNSVGKQTPSPRKRPPHLNRENIFVTFRKKDGGVVRVKATKITREPELLFGKYSFELSPKSKSYPKGRKAK